MKFMVLAGLVVLSACAGPRPPAGVPAWCATTSDRDPGHDRGECLRAMNAELVQINSEIDHMRQSR